MKHILKKILFIFSGFLIAFSSVGAYRQNSAGAVSIQSTFYSVINEVISDYGAFDERLPGSEDEHSASEYIKNYLESKTEFQAYNDDFITDGVQSFRFESILDGKYHNSQNIIFNYKFDESSPLKVVIGCSYDSVAYKIDESQETMDFVESEGLNESGGSVALMLALAKCLPYLDVKCNVELIFFGAGNSNNAGAKFYTSGLTEEKANNILLYINFDKVSLGENVYYYVDEIKNSFSDFVNTCISDNGLSVREVMTANLCKTITYQPNELGMGYTHIAIMSNNIEFMAEGILSMNMFAGSYSSGIMLGLSEYLDKEVITYTENDNFEYISNNYDKNAVVDNLFSAFEAVTSLLCNENFVAVCQKADGETQWLYKIFGNKKFAGFLTILASISMVMVAMIIYYKLTKKSYYSNIEVGFANTVLTISDNIGEVPDDINSIKIVSDTIVRDIKKDKRIKQNKQNKKDDK